MTNVYTFSIIRAWGNPAPSNKGSVMKNNKTCATEFISRNTDVWAATSYVELEAVERAAERLTDEEFAKIYDDSKDSEVENARHNYFSAMIRKVVDGDLVRAALDVKKCTRCDICDACDAICRAYDDTVDKYTSERLSDMWTHHTAGTIADETKELVMRCFNA